eukprot:CAMPEP_0170554084 /NCGR_PEP_ID=MMETSP0211-20121228/11960_1 /TAXON_ID=311385 /ORGANISM="Pseudokeronopsis sp., Strain OXSARD2" /LENGTH=49 /DNA_ID= /DNA_START= /DNA_END= /DNA_ORIENTATION=
MTSTISMSDLDIKDVSSYVVGQINTKMTFLITLSIPIFTGDQMVISVPE